MRGERYFNEKFKYEEMYFIHMFNLGYTRVIFEIIDEFYEWHQKRLRWTFTTEVIDCIY